MSSPLFERLRASGPEAAEFLKNVQPVVVSRSPEPLLPGAADNTCWLWQGPAGTRGVACTEGEAVARRAHKIFIGPIPAGHVVKQACLSRLCVNPRHLRSATPAESGAESSGLLTPAERGEVADALAGVASQADVARRFGITQAAVSAIKSKQCGAASEQAPAKSLAEWLDRQDKRLGPVGRLARGELMSGPARETAISKATKEYMTYSLMVREYEARAGRERAAA